MKREELRYKLEASSDIWTEDEFMYEIIGDKIVHCVVLAVIGKNNWMDVETKFASEFDADKCEEVNHSTDETITVWSSFEKIDSMAQTKELIIDRLSKLQNELKRVKTN